MNQRIRKKYMDTLHKAFFNYQRRLGKKLKCRVKVTMAPKQN